MSKYNNQEPMKIPEDKKEYEKAIEEWAEGNESLKKLLILCNNVGVKTFTCCGGHKDRFASPYISVVVDENNFNLIVDVFKRIYKNLDEIFSIGFSLNNGDNGFTITTKIDNPNEKFDEIYNIIKNYNENNEEEIEIEENVEKEIKYIIELHKFMVEKNIPYSINLVDIENTGNAGIYFSLTEKDSPILELLKENKKFKLKNETYVKENDFYSIAYYLDNYDYIDLKELLDGIKRIYE